MSSSSDAIREPAVEDLLTEMADGPSSEERVGEVLARTRATQGLTLDDIAQQLKFSPRQIEALEQNRFDELPGNTFARGMIRSYARLLKLDADSLLGKMEGKLEVPDADRLAARYREPVPFSDGSRRSNIVYALLSVAILLVVGAVLYGWQQERSGAPRLTFVPAARAPLEPPRTTLAAPAPTPAATPIATPVATSPVAAVGAPEPQAASPAAPAPAPSAAAGVRRIRLHFDAESWVEIRDGAGKLLMAQLNPADSERTVQGVPPFAVVIGNAQHVRVAYDGQPFDLAPHIKVEVARFSLK